MNEEDVCTYLTKRYYREVYVEKRTPPKSEEEYQMEIREFIETLKEGEGYSTEEVVVRYKTRLYNSFGLTRFYTYLFNTGLTRFINIGKDYRKADALIVAIIKYDTSHFGKSHVDIINGLYEHFFNDVHKVYMQTYMYQQKYINKKKYRNNMIELCGTPILDSKLISRSYISISGSSRYLNEYVYETFYSDFTGVSNYNLWVGHTSQTTHKPVHRPNKVYDSFTVTLDIKEKIPYLVDVINSGINYRVRFNKKFTSRSNIELLMDSLADSCKKSSINTSLKQKIGNSVEQFDEKEMADLDQFVFKMRSINKTLANKIARANPEGCVGYNTYKKL